MIIMNKIRTIKSIKDYKDTFMGNKSYTFRVGGSAINESYLQEINRRFVCREIANVSTPSPLLCALVLGGNLLRPYDVLI